MNGSITNTAFLKSRKLILERKTSIIDISRKKSRINLKH